MSSYCVIGAGAAGLSALDVLTAAGHEVDCYEKSDRVGGHWNTDYDALHLITARDQTVFEGYPMPEDYPHFPRRDQVRDYIAGYAGARGHDRRITFNTEVLSVTPATPAAPSGTDGDDGSAGPVGSSGWTVTTTAGTRTYDGVLVANGHLWDPKIPAVPGTFTGKQIHSSGYQNVGDIEGTRVLVVGAGNSGCDLAVDVAQHRLEADIVVRHAPYFQPKTYFGRPRQQLDFLAEFSASEQDLIARLLARVSIGRNSDYPGLPVPRHQALADGPAVVNDLLLYWIHHGRVRAVGHGVERFDGRTVHFADGSSREYDTILWATGFHPTLPFLEDRLVPKRAGRPLRHGGGIVPQGLEKLYFIGLAAPRGPQIPVYGVQAKLVARMAALHERAGAGGAGIAAYLGRLQEADDRIDIPRDIWNAQIADTERLLDAYEAGPVPTP
ncbi:NAD(P)-binding domain-containing protein [Streptomyces sp. NPDC093085]|uniref:flavin-containing monooxygenase n=1 Tax=Streptomyces sp. NPDC093085 TaxID=3155068 RepID=UPI003433AE0B